MKHKLLKFQLAFFAPLLMAGSLNAQCTAATPSASGTTINCGNAATLNATGAVGYQWWDQAVGGTLLGSSATYTTPLLFANASYWVEGEDATPQAMMGLPAHTSVFTGNVRGYWFTAPVNFTITGLKEPVEVSGLQNIAVVRLPANPPVFSATTNTFTTLFLTQNDPTVGIIPVNIPVAAGDIIGILGQAGTNNSYGATNYATTIAGQPVTLARLGMQFPLNTTAPQQLWTETSGSISRVEMYYTTPCTPSPRVQVDVTVTPIPVSATAVNSTICNGSNTTLNASGATTYTWMPGNITGSSITVSPTTTTTYTVQGDDPSGCSNTATVTVNVNPLPTVTASAASSIICTGSSDVLTAGGASTYVWSSGGNASTETVSPTSMTTYTVTGTDANGCANTATVMVDVNPLPTVTATESSSPICAGSSDVLTAGGASTYVWSSGGNASTETVSPMTTSTYTVTGTDVNGCTNTATVSVTVNPLPTVTGTSTNTMVCLDSPIQTLTGTPAGGAWTGPGVTGNSFDPASAGVGTQTVTYNYTDVNGCSNSAIVTIDVNICTVVGEQVVLDGVSVFPNPNNGVFTLAANANVGDLKIVITDLQGRVVYSSMENNVQVGFAKQINLQTETAGLYLMHISANGQQRTEKISIQK